MSADTLALSLGDEWTRANNPTTFEVGGPYSNGSYFFQPPMDYREQTADFFLTEDQARDLAWWLLGQIGRPALEMAPATREQRIESPPAPSRAQKDRTAAE